MNGRELLRTVIEQLRAQRGVFLDVHEKVNNDFDHLKLDRIDELSREELVSLFLSVKSIRDNCLQMVSDVCRMATESTTGCIDTLVLFAGLLPSDDHDDEAP